MTVSKSRTDNGRGVERSVEQEQLRWWKKEKGGQGAVLWYFESTGGGDESAWEVGESSDKKSYGDERSSRNSGEAKSRGKKRHGREETLQLVGIKKLQKEGEQKEKEERRDKELFQRVDKR